jgi:hypothetical protein
MPEQQLSSLHLHACVSRNTCGSDWGPHEAKEAVNNLRQSITPFVGTHWAGKLSSASRPVTQCPPRGLRQSGRS